MINCFRAGESLDIVLGGPLDGFVGGVGGSEVKGVVEVCGFPTLRRGFWEVVDVGWVLRSLFCIFLECS